jgi:hypothetical protein
MRSFKGGLAFVRHSANEAFGETVTDIDLGSFLALGPDNPEHRESLPGEVSPRRATPAVAEILSRRLDSHARSTGFSRLFDGCPPAQRLGYCGRCCVDRAGPLVPEVTHAVCLGTHPRMEIVGEARVHSHLQDLRGGAIIVIEVPASGRGLAPVGSCLVLFSSRGASTLPPIAEEKLDDFGEQPHE